MQVGRPKGEDNQATKSQKETLAKIEERDLEGSGNDSPKEASPTSSRLHPPPSAFAGPSTPLSDSMPSADSGIGLKRSSSPFGAGDAEGAITALAFSQKSLTAQRALR